MAFTDSPPLSLFPEHSQDRPNPSLGARLDQQPHLSLKCYTAKLSQGLSWQAKWIGMSRTTQGKSDGKTVEKEGNDFLTRGEKQQYEDKQVTNR